MITTSSTTYRTLEMWSKDCDTLFDQDKGRCPADIGPDGRLTVAVPAHFRPGAVTGAGDKTESGRSATPVGTGLIMYINQMHQDALALCRQAGVYDRTIVQIADRVTTPLAVQDLKVQLDSLLNAPGSQFVRLHEHLDQIIELAGKNCMHPMLQLMRDLPDVLVTSYRIFLRACPNSEQARFRQFSSSLSLWMDKTRQRLEDTQELEHEGGDAFRRLRRMIHIHLQDLDPTAKPYATHQPPQRTARDLLPAQKPLYPVQEADAGDTAIAPPPKRPLPPAQEPVFHRMLETIGRKLPEAAMTRERLLGLLRDPTTGTYDLLHPWFSAFTIIHYLKLQHIRPDVFPDEDFPVAVKDPDISLYGYMLPPQPDSEAFQDWVTDSAVQMQACRAARHALKQWKPLLEPLMPEHSNFRRHLRSKVPHKNILAAIPADELSWYRETLEQELYRHLRIFGPDSMNEEVLACIFKDCCEELLQRCCEDYALKQSQHQKYKLQEFDWLDRKKHSYFYTPKMNFIAYYDVFTFAAFRKDLEKSGHKFRISLHPHDYEKAWPLVAEVLHGNTCPFLLWKSTYPWPNALTLGNRRFNNGGQFTLYCVDAALTTQALPQRLREDMIAQTLIQIEGLLRKHSIRPGRQPSSDLPCGQGHPYISYRFDMDKTRQKYEAASEVTHQRRRDYMKEAYYQNVSQLLDQEAIKQQGAQRQKSHLSDHQGYAPQYNNPQPGPAARTQATHLANKKRGEHDTNFISSL